MSMNKKEQAYVAELENQILSLKAWKLTEPVAPDIPVPSYGQSELSKGWLYNVNSVYHRPYRVEVACSSSVNHSFGRNDKTTTQRARALYSTQELALRAARYEYEQQALRVLAQFDQDILSALESAND